ncbi:Protein of unknown function (DUF1162) [Abeliophyllum distichum]|uniref:Vacuolar protein sorting-associated protein 13A n=1 Tax=Abeliophyllum distichum TaxID=126358 RepID=A0ABD1R991_9LAMI
MFEGLVRQLILGYLGQYIKDIQKEQLKITLWHEEVFLENVELILEAFDYLQLPFALTQGRVGKLSIKIPWKKLGWDPIIIILEDVYVCACNRDDEEWCMDAVERREYASKKAKLAAAELAKLSRRVCDNQAGKSFISYITAKILDNIQVSIRNVHVLYRDTLIATATTAFGLKFESLTIMKQNPVGSSIAKVRGGQVNKLIEVKGLEFYCNTFQGADDLSSESLADSKRQGSDICMLAPLDVSVSLSVNRSGKLEKDAPQNTISVEFTRVVMSMNEVQLQQILILCDYLSLCQLRETYGRYRPWRTPLERKIKGWQIAWWQYAQQSVLSDVRRRLRKTSWKYLGERLNCRRKYVSLYRIKLKCLKQDQVIEEDVQKELEEMEKETDIDDILGYRSVAEHELEDFLVNSPSSQGSNVAIFDKSLEDSRLPSKPRGWLNWLSRGMLGAGGTDDSSQFSGVISDDIIKDIYEATKFHPAPLLNGDAAVMDEVFFSSIKLNIREIYATLRSVELGRAIADVMLDEISIEGKVWEKSVVITASVKSAQMLNPCNNQFILLTKKVYSEENLLEIQPSLNIKIDLSPPNSDVSLSFKVILHPTELICDSKFLRNILDYFHVLKHLSFQQERILLSLNGIDNLHARLLSKIDYVLSNRKKLAWDINLLNAVIIIPWENANSEAHKMVMEAGPISFVSNHEIGSFSSHTPDQSCHLNNYIRSNSTQDIPMELQFQDLYDHFEININNLEMKIMMPCASAPIPLFEKFNASSSLASCIILDEPILKGLEVHIKVSSLFAHFSASMYEEILGLIEHFNLLLPPLDSVMPLDVMSNEMKTSTYLWYSITTSLDMIDLLVNLEDDVTNGYTLMLCVQMLDLGFDQKDIPECWASVKALKITACSPNNDQQIYVLCSTGSHESVGQENMGVSPGGHDENSDDKSSTAYGCILLHYEACRNIELFRHKYRICINNLDINCYSFIVGLIVRFINKVSESGTSNVKDWQPIVEGKNLSSRPGFDLQNFGFSNLYGDGSSEWASISLDHFPSVTSENFRSIFNTEDSAIDFRAECRTALNLKNQENASSEFSNEERAEVFSSPLLKPNAGAESLQRTFSANNSILVDMKLGSIAVHFHDSSCIIGTVSLPMAKSLFSVCEDHLDVVCSTEGLILSSLQCTQTLHEFLWGPASLNLSPMLNLRLRKETTDLLKSHLEIDFSIQHVSCILPPDFLATVIGYFSLPDWNFSTEEGPTSKNSESMNSEDTISITYKFEILDCELITPARDCTEFVKVDIEQLCISFLEDIDSSMVLKGIPSVCRVSTDKLADRNHCIDLTGHNLSLSLLLLKGDMVDSSSRYQNVILVAPLSADVWVRIPSQSEFSNVASSCPVCVMASVSSCQVDIEGVFTVVGLEALVYVIDQFSMVNKKSKIFMSNISQFLQLEEHLLENASLQPEASTVTFTEMRFCMKSLSIRLHHMKRESTSSEVVAEAEMQFTCTASLMNEKPLCFYISFSSLALFSLLNSVMLAECTSPGSGSSVLDMSLSVSDHGENHLVVSLPSLDVWVHLFDWSEIFDLLGSCIEQPFVTLASDPSENIDLSSCTSSTNMRHGACFFTLTLENLGMAIHIPAQVSGASSSSFWRPHTHNEQCLSDFCGRIIGNRNCFLSITLHSRSTVLVADGKTMKLKVNLEKMIGTMNPYMDKSEQTWPLFQLFQIDLEAEIFSYTIENADAKVEFICDNLDVQLSDHILHFLQFAWLEKSDDGPFQFIFKSVEFTAQLKNFSLLLNDSKWTSRGPLLELLLSNLIFCSNVMLDKIEGSIGSELRVNYNNIEKVLWEPFVEPWKFQSSMSRKHDESTLLNSALMTDIHLESTSQLNLNVTESLVEVVSRVIEMIKDAWGLMGMTESSKFFNSRINENLETGRYAPYILQNLTTLPLAYNVCQGRVRADDIDLSQLKCFLQPGSSTPVYVNESPEEQLFRYGPVQSSDRLTDKQLLEAAHHYIIFQLEGTSIPSDPISMDLVGRRYFEVDFSKSSNNTELGRDADIAISNKKVEEVGRTGVNRGFIVPVVIDVSVQRYTKLMRLYSTVVLLNATSLSLEVRFDIPFGVSPKILGPIFPGQEFPLPLHLAESGRIRWRPLGDMYLWSEAYNMSSIVSNESRISFLRSFVCYPSHPSSDAFRCCISVHDQCLPSTAMLKKVLSPFDVDSGKHSFNGHNQFSNNLERPKDRFLHQVTLTSPLVLKNYLPEAMCLTLENAGVTRTAFLSEVETSLFHVDSSHDLSVTFQLRGFKPSLMKFPRAETFSAMAKFSGTRFSVSEVIKFDPELVDGPLFVTMEKVMDAFSGAREIHVSVPYLLYNCTGFTLRLSNSINEMKGYSCIIPSCYNIDKENLLFEKKDGLGFLCLNLDMPAATGSTSETNLNSPDFVESDSKKADACLFSPDPNSFSGEIMVRLSRYLPSVMESYSKHSWSSPFSLVPPTGSISVLIPQPLRTSGYVVSVSVVAAPFSGKTKFITFQHRYVISNACTKNLCYKQKGTAFAFTLGAGRHSHIQWMDTLRELLISVRFDEPGWEWSGCFLPEHLGDTQIKMRNYISGAINMIRVEVQSADVSIREEKIVGSPHGNSGTNLILLSDDDTGFMPYRIDNMSRERLRIYQPRCESFETLIQSYTSAPYSWDEPCYPHRLTIEVPGERVLGSYALDDVKVHSFVYLPATSEKPERNLLISVHSEGAIKVLSIIDSSYHVLNDLKSLHVPQLKDKRKPIQKYETSVHYKERISVDIPFLGISLMNSHPEELLFACAKNMKVNFVQSLDRQQFSLQVSSLQIDNQLNITPYPVILSFDHGNKGNLVNQVKYKEDSIKMASGSMTQIAYHEPVFSLAVAKWRNKDSLVSFEHMSLRIADFYLQIEQEVVLRLFDFFKTLSSRLESRIFQHVDSTQHQLFPDFEFSRNAFVDVGKRAYSTNITMLNQDYKRSCLLPKMVPIGAPWQQIYLLARKQKKIYVELFDMAPIKFTLSFSSSPWMLRNGVLTSGESLIHRGLMALADVEGAKIHLNQLILSHQLASWESIQEILISHYTRQILHEMYKVFGSAGVIGNPMGFVRSLGLGIKDFLSLPIWNVFQSPSGLVTGVAQGTTSLVSNTVYAISDATSQFSKAAHKGIVAFTFDDQTVTKMEKHQKGMSSHSKGVINEFLEGLTGVLQSPIKGAEKHGLPGLLSGIAVGVTGLVARPAASILEVTGKTAQSIRNRSRLHQMGHGHLRVRLPRPLSRDFPLRPYSWEEAVASSVFTEADMKLRDETLVMCKALNPGGRFVIITKRLVLVVSCSNLKDLGKPEFEGVPADPKWVIESEIGLESVIHADNDNEVVHIVGSSSDTTTRQNQHNQKRAKGKQWSILHTPLPLLQTNLIFTCQEAAEEFLEVLMSTIEKGKEQGWGFVYVLHQSNIK